MRTRKRTEITIETDRIFVLSRRKVSLVSWCNECGQRTTMVTVDEAAAIAGVTSRTMYRWADAQKLHFTETADGVLMICRASLTPSEINAR
ncbi:MAG TPA: helix-turn-helix domain-containing protein [Blastocatellia bacterium]|nr:helix-turn-helix domain-containing protein [Blastocatellia bacterium]